MLQKKGMHKPVGMLHEYRLLKMPMEKGIGDVELMDGPATADGDGEQHANSGDLDYRAKGFMKIDTRLLSLTFGDQPCFVTINGTICLIFELKYPLVGYNIHLGMSRHKGPRAITQERVELSSHSCLRTKLVPWKLG